MRRTKPCGIGLRALLDASLVLSLFLLSVGGNAPMALAQSTSPFTPTGSMTTPRAGHTATLLPNGKVLIAGGYMWGFPPAIIASAELYDPSTGTFSPTGNLTTARAGHTATLLPEGRVLIIGGNGLASAELYDPSSGTFTATGNMHSPQGYFDTATLLGNGKVLVAGNSPLAEVYDPATGTFAFTGAYAGSYPDGAGIDTSTLLLDGRVLLTGCDCAPPTPMPVVELYDPVTGKFSLTGTVGGPAGWWENVNTATLLMNGKVLIAGDDGEASAQAVLYDSANGKWEDIGNTNAPHEFSTATLLSAGRVLIAGGQLPGGNGSAGVDLYSPATNTFYNPGAMTTGRHEHTATTLPDGTILMAGGFSSWPFATSTAELFTPPTSVWQQAITAIKAAAGSDSQNFWYWAWYWQYLPAFQGAPLGFGTVGSISPGLMEQIITAGGGNGFQTVSAEQWVQYYRQSAQPPSAWQPAITAIKTAAGTDSQNFWYWAWYWQYLPAFQGAPLGFGVVGSISSGLMEQIIMTGGGDGFHSVSAEQWLQYYRQAMCSGCWDY